MSGDQNLEEIPKTKQLLWKNCLVHLLKNYGNQQTFHEFIDNVTGDTDIKTLAQPKGPGFEEDILLFVFVLKGIGHISFQGNSKFTYAGRNAVIIKFIHFVNSIKNRLVQEGKIIESQSKAKKSSMNTEFPMSFKAPKQNKKFTIDKIELRPGVLVETKLYNYISEFAEKVIFSILFDQNRILSKAHLKQFKDYYKAMFQGSKQFDSVIHLFKVLQYLNISIQSPTIIWQGPDYINCLGVCTDDLYQIVNSKKTLEEFLYEHIRNFNNELFNREMMFYRQLFINDLKDQEFDIILSQFLQQEQQFQINEKTLRKLIPQLQVGYALLKFKTQNILLKKLQVILGRKNSSQQSKARWTQQEDFKVTCFNNIQL